MEEGEGEMGKKRKETSVSEGTGYHSRRRRGRNPADRRISRLGRVPTLNRAWPREQPKAAMRVRIVDDQGVLQFTLIHAVGCVLHRRGSRAIHRLQLFLSFSFSFAVRGRAPRPFSRDRAERE